jgi:hypothetical protein
MMIDSIFRSTNEKKKIIQIRFIKNRLKLRLVLKKWRSTIKQILRENK